MSFDKCICLCNQHLDQDIKHLHQQRKSTHAHVPLQLIPPTWADTNLIYVNIVFIILELSVNEIT